MLYYPQKVMRIAGETDARVVEENKSAAKEAFTTCLNKIRDHGLKMKLVDVEFTLTVIRLYFTLLPKDALILENWLRIWQVFFGPALSFGKLGYVMKQRC